MLLEHGAQISLTHYYNNRDMKAFFENIFQVIKRETVVRNFQKTCAKRKSKLKTHGDCHREAKFSKVKQWMNENNFAELKHLLEATPLNTLKSECLSGEMPLGGWICLNDLYLQSNSKSSLNEKQKELFRLTNRINELQQELADVEIQRGLIVEQIDLETSSPVEKAFRFLADSERKIVGQFKEKISAPNWSVDLMSGIDLKVAFNLLEVPHLLPPLLQVVDHETILLMDFNLFEEFKVELSLEEKMEVLYVVNMISLKQFDRNEHKERCGVCRIDDLEEVFAEHGISRQLCAKIRDQVGNLKPCQLMLYPVANLVQGIDGLSSVEKLKLVKVWNALHQLHTESLLLSTLYS